MKTVGASILAVSGAGSLGVLAGTAVSSTEMVAGMLSLSAVIIVPVVFVLTLVQNREWQAKVAILPILFSHIYYAHSFLFDQQLYEYDPYLAQALDSVGIVVLMYYFIWNRRASHANKESAAQKNSPKEKAAARKEEAHA